MDPLGTTFIRNLGTGNETQVQMRENDNGVYACKVSVRIGRGGDVDRLNNEKRILEHIHNIPNVQRYVDSAVCEGRTYLYSEVAPGTDMWNCDTEWTLEQYLRMFISLFETLEKLHDKEVYHRDIKPENIIVDDYENPVIIDFGHSVFSSDKKDDPELWSGMCGTLDYIHPHMIGKRTPRVFEYCDLFSMVLTMIEEMTGELPWSKERTHEDLMSKDPVEFKTVDCGNDRLTQLLDNIVRAPWEWSARGVWSCLSDVLRDISE